MPSGPTMMLWVLPIASFSATFCPFASSSLRVSAKAFLHPQLIRQPLMVETRRVGGFRDVHPEIDGIDHHLQYGGDDPTAARAAGHQPCFAIFHHNGRRH